MATGYRISGSQKGLFQWNQSRHLFYNSQNSRWYGACQDTSGSDWALWENDGSTPSAGSAGGWSIAQTTGAANVYLNTRDSGELTLCWEEGAGVNSEGRLHVFQRHATEYYATWDYGASGDDWVNTDTQADTGTSNADDSGFVVDSNGIPWIFWLSGTTIKARYRSGGSWSDDTDVATITNSVGIQIDAYPWFDDDGDAAICILYNDGNDYKFTSKKDSDTLGSASYITAETVYSPTTGDSHVALCAGLLGSDTTSTVFAIMKDGETSSNGQANRRSPAGSWGTTVEFSSVTTRPKGVVDETNGTLYVVCPDAGTSPTAIEYYTADATATLSFSGPTTVIEDDGVNTFRTDVSVPCHPVTGTTNLMVFGDRATGTDAVWWNELAIAGGVTGTLASTTRRNTFAASGTINPVTGTIAATSRRNAMAFTGDVDGVFGTIAATTRRNTFDAAGEVNLITGTIAATTRRNTFDAEGTVQTEPTGTFAAVTRRNTAALVGIVDVITGTMAATTRRNTMNFVGQHGDVSPVNQPVRLRKYLDKQVGYDGE